MAKNKMPYFCNDGPTRRSTQHDSTRELDWKNTGRANPVTLRLANFVANKFKLQQLSKFQILTKILHTTSSSFYQLKCRLLNVISSL